jgi:hypothetical protein
MSSVEGLSLLSVVPGPVSGTIFLKKNVSALQHEHFVDQAISGLVDSGSVVNCTRKTSRCQSSFGFCKSQR